MNSASEPVVTSMGVAGAAIAAVKVSKIFPGVRALDGVSFDTELGEIHSLVGENGAGKSTLVKLLSGLLQPDAGTVLLDGKPVTLHSPREARRHGVSVIPQDVLAVADLSVGRNVLLGDERFWVRKDRLSPDEEQAVGVALERAGGDFPASGQAGSLSVPELRLMQIAKTLTSPGEVIVLDEPTSVLAEIDADHLLSRLRRLRDEGKAIVYVSHRLSEVLLISDRITVLRDGRNVGTFARGEVTRERLVALMARADVPPAETTRAQVRQEVGRTPLIEVADLTGPGFTHVSITVSPGQVVGVAGMPGAGHGQLLRAIAGAVPFDGGDLRVDGVPMPPGELPQSYARGLVLLSADRRREAIVPQRSLRDNVVLPVNSRHARAGFRRLGEERRAAERYANRLWIRAPSTETPAGVLSGGNQQKVALARALESDARVLLMEEPSQGIDVGSKAEVRRLIRELVSSGTRGVLVASSEIEELLELADVIYVMRLGTVVARLEPREFSYETILHHALP